MIKGKEERIGFSLLKRVLGITPKNTSANILIWQSLELEKLYQASGSAFNPFSTRAKKIDRTYFFIENIYFMTLIHQIEKKILIFNL